MKRTNFILLALTLLLTFAGCNQKEKELEKIVDGINNEQILDIYKIAASAFDKNAYPENYLKQRNDTLIFGIVVDTPFGKEVG